MKFSASCRASKWEMNICLVSQNQGSSDSVPPKRNGNSDQSSQTDPSDCRLPLWDQPRSAAGTGVSVWSVGMREEAKRRLERDSLGDFRTPRRCRGGDCNFNRSLPSMSASFLHSGGRGNCACRGQLPVARRYSRRRRRYVVVSVNGLGLAPSETTGFELEERATPT